MWFWNINGFTGAAGDVVSFLRDERCDVLVLIDSQLTDTETIRRTLPGWKLLHESRPSDAHKRRMFGGITVLWRKENVRVWREGGYAKGALSFVVQDVAGVRKPLAVVALYSPPLASRFNRDGKQWSQDVLDWVALEGVRLWRKYGFVAVGGDFNWRLGRMYGRRTQDASSGDASGRAGMARRWHQQTGLRPLYGRQGQPSGVYTSRTENGMAEVDGISICGQVPEGWMAQAFEVPEWECYSDRGGVHRPVGAAFLAPLLEARPPQGAQAEGRGEARGGAAAASPRVSPLPYGSAQYHAMAERVSTCITETAMQLERGDVDAAGAFSKLAEGLVHVQNEFFAEARSGGKEARNSSGNVAGASGKAAGAAPSLKHRRQPPPFRRLASGTHVPPAVVAQLATRRTVIADLRRAKLQLRRAGGKLSPEARALLQQRIDNAKSTAATIMREVRKTLRIDDGKQIEAAAEHLVHLAVSNPRGFFRELNSKLPGSAGTYDESTGPSAEKCSAFRDFFADLLSNLRGGMKGDPVEVAEKYAGSVPATAAETHAMLVTAVSWQEVYAILYPAHKLAAREPCLPDCKLCPLFADHVEDFAPGDTRMTPPEHRPRLWTSKAAGPDGVFAETLRWACPESRDARHSYRQTICVALASIFSRLIESGRVPECPQFADSVMTALYKGDGDRDQATNYRGICAPNVLAKLFGLVLGTRLSHWAVVNGVISPAQAGFVVMHGCEYHIFTLLETLRHRVRQGQDTVLVFLDFKKAYDSVSQPLAWEVLKRMGIPDDFISLLTSWTSQSRISLRMGGETLPPFPQELGVPQGGVLSPVIFNLFIEVLLRHVNARAADLGIELSAEDAKKAGKSNLPEALRILALAYADDVVLVCPNKAAAQEALRLVEAWAADFGMTVGVGQGKSMAMLVSAATVVQACNDDVNGMLKKGAASAAADADEEPAPPSSAENSDDDRATEIEDPDDEEWLPGDDPVVEAPAIKRPSAHVKSGGRGKGEKDAADSKKPRSYSPRPLPPLPTLPPLRVAIPAASGDGDPVDVEVPWTSLYKYLGFMLRSDLLDDHAYERVEKKTKAAAERLFPHHRLVKAWPLGLKLQVLQTLVLSITAHVLPLLTSMRCASETKTTRLDNLRKKIARNTLRLQGSARFAYVMAEAGLGDVMGDVTQHRLRLSHSLALHPLKTLAAPPIACRVQEIMAKEAEVFNQRKHSLLLAPWDVITDRIVLKTVQKCDEAGWQRPDLRREVAPYASAVARVGERERWITRMQKGIDWMCDSFALRPPHGARRQTAALHWTSRLGAMDAGSIPKLTPLSYRGPRGCPIVSLSRRRSKLSSVITSMRQGEASMERFPFAAPERSAGKSKVAAAAEPHHRRSWKVCHLCAADDEGSRYDLWHVLFECPKTRDTVAMADVRDSCKAFVPQLCYAIEMAVDRNAESLGDTRNAGVSHSATLEAAADVRAATLGYQWDCEPGRWLIYTLLLALPFPAVGVRPDAQGPVWLRRMRKRGGSELPRNVRGMPAAVPVLPEEQYSLPEAVGRLFDSTILSNDALRPLADAWCRLSEGNLLRAGATVRPLRAAVDERRSIAAAEAGRGDAALRDGGEARSVTSVSSDGSPPGSDSE